MAKHVSDPLVEALEGKRWDLRMSPTDFASFLGIGRTTWFDARRGLRVGPVLRLAALRKFPELALLAEQEPAGDARVAV